MALLTMTQRSKRSGRKLKRVEISCWVTFAVGIGVELHLDRDPLALAVSGDDVDALVGLQAEADALAPVIPQPDIGEADRGVVAEKVSDDMLEGRAHALPVAELPDVLLDALERGHQSAPCDVRPAEATRARTSRCLRRLALRCW